MHLGLISSGYPPDLDGIGDYSWWLARTLARQNKVHVFTRTGAQHKPSPNVEVVSFFDLSNSSSFTSLIPHVESWVKKTNEPHWLILQYNPFCYGSRGYCPWVPRTLRLITQQYPHLNIAVMFHETTVPMWPWKFAVMFSWQWLIFRAVCRSADIALISTTRWMPQIRRVAPHLRVEHLPVGSNIPFCDATRSDARARLGIDKDAVILGVFGSAHPSKLPNWIGAAARKLATVRRNVFVLYVGPHGSKIEETCAQVPVINTGPLPAEEVGLRFRAMDVAISPFVDGISTRRTSAIAFWQHNIPLATTRSLGTEDLFMEWAPPEILLSDARSMNAFANDFVAWFLKLEGSSKDHDNLREFHDRFFGWDRLADKMMKTLRSANAIRAKKWR